MNILSHWFSRKKELCLKDSRLIKPLPHVPFVTLEKMVYQLMNALFYGLDYCFIYREEDPANAYREEDECQEMHFLVLKRIEGPLIYLRFEDRESAVQFVTNCYLKGNEPLSVKTNKPLVSPYWNVIIVEAKWLIDRLKGNTLFEGEDLDCA